MKIKHQSTMPESSELVPIAARHRQCTPCRIETVNRSSYVPSTHSWDPGIKDSYHVMISPPCMHLWVIIDCHALANVTMMTKYSDFIHGKLVSGKTKVDYQQLPLQYICKRDIEELGIDRKLWVKIVKYRKSWRCIIRLDRKLEKRMTCQIGSLSLIS